MLDLPPFLGVPDGLDTRDELDARGELGSRVIAEMVEKRNSIGSRILS
jgi:hypothetical protein